MVRKLYIGNLPFTYTEGSLKDLCSNCGTVETVKIVTDMATGRSKGFGFVEMSTPEEANSAVQSLNGSEVDGRTIRVDLAKPKEAGFKGNRSGSFERRGPRSSSSNGLRSGGESRSRNNNRW